MSIPLQNARLCLDCDTVFDEPRCPSCSSESYFPLSRWVRPAIQADTVKVRSKAKKASLVLLGGGAAFALWKLLQKSSDGKPPREESSQKPEARSQKESEPPK
jgi:hypothetical protein